METISFWIPIIIFAAIIALTIYMAIRASHHSTNAREQANKKLREMQLDVVNQQLNSGQIDGSEAEAMRLEVGRAFSRSSRRGEDAPSSQGPIWAIWALLGFGLLASIFIYARLGVPAGPDMPFAKQNEWLRPTQERAVATLEERGESPELPPIDGETADLIAKLEERLAEHPEEAEGWKFLARSSYSTGRFQRAYEAQSRYLDLIGEEATADDYTVLAESMILAAKGYISPEAETALRQALTLDPSSRVGRYYAALTMIQEGDVQDGRAILTRLLEETKDDENWTREISRRLEETALAQDPSERDEMIASMVDGLKARLANEGGSPEEWARLVNSLRVLGRDQEADAIKAEAKQKFPDAPEIQGLK